MRLVEETSEGLTRTARMRAEAEELDARLVRRLEALRARARLPGFRPGKAPLGHLRRLHGRTEMRRVVEEALDEGVREVVARDDVRIVGRPEIEPVGSLEATIEGSAPLEFLVRVESRPEFTLADLRTITLENPRAETTDADVDAALAKLAEANPRLAPRADGEGAQEGDVVMVDVDAVVGGKPFPPAQGRGVRVALGSGRSPEALETALIGAKPDEEREASVMLTTASGGARQAKLIARVREILAPTGARDDEALAKELGMETLEALRTALRESLVAETARAARATLRRRLMDALDAAHPMTLPEKVVARELEAIWRDRDAAENEDDAAREAARADYRAIAERRVRLGLVFAEIAAAAKIAVSETELHELLTAEAAARPGPWGRDGRAFAQANPQLADALSAATLEHKIVDYALELAQIEDAPMDRAALLALAAEGDKAEQGDAA